MLNLLFIFFAGIALSLGLIEVWLGIIKRKFDTDFLFGVFALAAGSYYLSIGLQLPFSLLTLMFAVIMFAVFPWYYALELNFVRKTFLWVITGLSVGYSIVVALNLPGQLAILSYVFSYGVYALTAIYCFMGLAHVKQESRYIFFPFLLVTLYYAIFIMEEISYNYYGMRLPWRRQFNFQYLDLFPLIIIVNKYGLLIRDQWAMGALERSVKYYRENLNLILDKADQLVAVLDTSGTVLYVNSSFKDLLEIKHTLRNQSFIDMLKGPDRIEFRREVLESNTTKGKLIIEHATRDADMTVTWSFIKQSADGNPDVEARIFLFGSDITRLKKSERNLREAFEELERLKNKLQAENIQLKNLVQNNSSTLIGRSPNFLYVLNRIDEVAQLDVTVLLEGETGVGKEVLATKIHQKSFRSEQPFIKVNCSAIPHDLIESELFGHQKGAFTGAFKAKRGMFELADKGTSFLDEIGELPLSMQPKLLRVLQEGELQPLGAESTKKIDVRVIAATNKILSEEVRLGNFRSDLFYRINVFPITAPPLRKRKEDIPLLAEHFIGYFNQKYSKGIKTISKSLMDTLIDYPWPGNIRQLRNVIERSVISTTGAALKLTEALPNDGKDSYHPEEDHTFLISLSENNKAYISRVLELKNWKISGKDGAASILGLPPSTLRSKMKKLGIRPPADHRL